VIARAGTRRPSSVRAEAAACRACRACPLYERATQSVFGEGPTGAIMLVGEQPGNDEDLAGHPFVGPAGRVLDAALAEAGLARAEVYLTNAVKHFSFVERGKLRLHKKPTTTEVVACRPWLLDEIAIVQPPVVVALGATAALSLFGPKARVTSERGQPFATETRGLPAAGAMGLLTFHPSAVLRGPTPERRHELRALLVADLTLARELGLRRRAAAQR
jgi:uracil-DNA glycosylase family protein